MYTTVLTILFEKGTSKTTLIVIMKVSTLRPSVPESCIISWNYEYRVWFFPCYSTKVFLCPQSSGLIDRNNIRHTVSSSINEVSQVCGYEEERKSEHVRVHFESIVVVKFKFHIP